MIMYRKSEEPFSEELFAKPSKEYRSAPFWAWNTELHNDVIDEQIGMLHEMGMGGYHIHVRTGLKTEYLGTEFLGYVRHALDSGKKKGMLTYLYDEDRWPSGACGGAVVKETPEYRAGYLVITPRRTLDKEAEGGVIGSVTFRQDPERILLKCYDIRLDSEGYLISAEPVEEDSKCSGRRWYVFFNHASNDGWFNNQTYIDTLNPGAAKSFIDHTHEKYKSCLGNEFQTNIPSIFTDEPQFVHKNTLDFAAQDKDVILPWTPDFPDSFAREYGISVWDALPEVIWNRRDGKIPKYRYYFHDHLSERFVTGYMDVIASWCRKNNLICTGHVLHEQTLESQTQALGEAMRCYREMQMPGIDMLCNNYEYNTAKQAQSVVHQNGAEGMMSELYGVTGWDFDFRGFKLQGDWQAALGVTLRVPHLTWMTMEGEAKRDYPPCIGYQSPWWTKFHLLEDYFARINVVLTRGNPLVKVGVIHPIESYWTLWGPSDQSAMEREEMEQNFADLTEWLLFGLIDFDFISESCLVRQQNHENPRAAGKMEYETVVVPPCVILRKTTIEWLKGFEASGGKIIFLGKEPVQIDGEHDPEFSNVYKRSQQVPFKKTEVLECLENCRVLEVHKEDGNREERLAAQIRQEGEERWLFIASAKPVESKDIDPSPRVRISVRGKWKITELDPWNGKINAIRETETDGKSTFFYRRWHMHDSLLLHLAPGSGSGKADWQAAGPLIPGGETENIKPDQKFIGTVKIRCSEKNALLLDRAEYSLNGEKYHAEEELLRIDNACREKLGIPLRKKHIVQPYLLSEKENTDYVTLKFHVVSECCIPDVWIAMEHPEKKKVLINGENVSQTPDGWYVDHAIKTVKLPGLIKGENEILVREPIGEKTNMEWMYLLGGFSVYVSGTERVITGEKDRLGFGDIVPQGFPYYTGNIAYCMDIFTEENQRYRLRVPSYRGALVSVKVDGKEIGDIICSPYTLDLPDMKGGKHCLELVLYGNRNNGFGQVHHEQTMPYYQSPDSWRSSGDLWCDEYWFKEIGIMKSPELYKLGEERF